MTIDGVDISTFGARQWNVKPDHQAVENKTEWPEKFLTPIFLKSDFGLKKYEVTLLIKGTSRDDIWKKAGMILRMLSKPSDIKLDGFNNTFRFALTGHSQNEDSKKRFHTLTLELEGYEYGETVSFGGITEVEENFEHTSQASAPSPCRLTIQLYCSTSLFTYSWIGITGLTKKPNGEDAEIRVKNLKSEGAKEEIVIDETGNVTFEGENKNIDVEIFGVPHIMPGENKIEFRTASNKQVPNMATIEYNPRFL